MSDKVTPATKSMGTSGGVKKGDTNTTLTTPGDNEGRVWNRDKEQTNRIFGKK